MNCFAAILLIFSCHFNLHAQTPKVFKVKPGERPADVIPHQYIYKYPGFEAGNVFMKNGGFGNAKMNYNSLFGEIQFIDQKGDTLSLADEKTISLITINKDSFYYNNDDGCLELIANYRKVKLARKKILRLSDRTKTGGLNQSGAGEIETYTTLSNKQNLKEIVMNETLTFSQRTIYFFGDKFNHFIIANKKNLFKIYGEQQAEISNYLNENKVNFTNEDDLKKLGLFLLDL